MKPGKILPPLFAAVVMFISCAGQNDKIVFRPDAPPDHPPGVNIDVYEIVENQSGPGSGGLPEWVIAFLGGGIRETEALYQYQDKYFFVSENRGTNASALRQWADNFSAAQDFPRLAAMRVEKRLTAAAVLYPDDEYGEYFEVLIKKVFDAEYPGVVREDSFWIKRQIEVLPPGTVTEAAPDPALPEESYDFFILVSIDKNIFQAKIRELMSGIKTTVPPSRSQAASISRIQQTFFEDF
ncbi:MAG: hypothetical protein LBD48_10595 [Treponema sp.]|jgi:hypothetical protein|nr:hypothetical protein [Treponema sp.]